MPCYAPLKGYRARDPHPDTGRHGIVFDPSKGHRDKPVKLPCGGCIGCRIERSRQWAIRCSHEAAMYSENTFVTLTYNDANLPPLGTLDKAHFQKFMKRLRRRFPTNQIKYYHCGEYGEQLSRPHYHACLFNFGLEDRIHYKTTNKQKLYTSETLNELWPFGFSLVGDVTYQSAAYVARYILKKMTGAPAENHYERMDPATGELIQLQPEYATMSRGIGEEWLKQFEGDLYPDDFVVIDGKKAKIPRYYDNKYKEKNPDQYTVMRGIRVRNSKKKSWNETPERLRVRETVQQAKLKQLKREVETE